MTIPRFSDLQDVDELSRAVGKPASDIVRYAQSSDQASFYTLVKIPKRGRKRRGEFRVVHRANEDWLAQLHRGVAIIVVASTAFPECVQGFVSKRSILTNARFHLGARRVLHADIRGFFDAISIEQVRRGLVSIGAHESIAELVARACTIDGLLRQGTRCSPALSNLVCRQLDIDLITLANAHGARYTRYADDMTFSGDSTPASETVEAVLKQNGFELRDGRCYLQRRGKSQFVTGLHVGDEERPRLPRRLKRRLRLVAHFIEKFGTDAHFERHAKSRVVADHLQLEGMLRFVQSVEPELAWRLRRQCRRGSEKARALRKQEEERECEREQTERVGGADDPHEN